MPKFDGGAIFAPVRAALANGGSPTEKGSALERAMSTLFLSIPGIWHVEQNALDNLQEGELDLGVGNMKEGGSLPFLPDTFIVECKNWKKPVGSQSVIVFVEKLRQRACDFGIIIASNGITGDVSEHNAATATVATALRDRIKLIILTLDELESLESVDEFVELIRIKLLRLTLYRGPFR